MRITNEKKLSLIEIKNKLKNYKVKSEYKQALYVILTDLFGE